eukprot:SAG31_NODE_20967_length_560_cov_3.288503_1_plen_35_part_10
MDRLYGKGGLEVLLYLLLNRHPLSLEYHSATIARI